jgi:hypothetical protein
MSRSASATEEASGFSTEHGASAADKRQRDVNVRLRRDRDGHRVNRADNIAGILNARVPYFAAISSARPGFGVHNADQVDIRHACQEAAWCWPR